MGAAEPALRGTGDQLHAVAKHQRVDRRVHGLPREASGVPSQGRHSRAELLIGKELEGRDRSMSKTIGQMIEVTGDQVLGCLALFEQEAGTFPCLRDLADW